ncbi:MAG: thiolase C-terminal domain-containing protein [Pseudolabrys sp.]
MQPVYVCGVGMNRFGKYPDRTLKDLAGGPIADALADAGVQAKDIQAAFVANSMAGIVTGQEAIRGQTILPAHGISGLPIVNVENACASGSTALHQAVTAVLAGLYDIVLVLGVEKLFHTDRSVSYRALSSATDLAESAAGGGSSVFLEESNRRLAKYMERAGATIAHVAKIAEKSHRNGARNPLAQYREVYTADEIMASPVVTAPLTRLMCSPIGDGAAALVVCSQAAARRLGRDQVRIAASVLRSATGQSDASAGIAERSVVAAYEMAGVGPGDLDVVELHDTTAASELMLYERLGLCAAGGAPALVDSGATEIGGRIPVNPSGGLISRGHPVGATGVAQICELTWQLRGAADGRQVAGARVALAHNAGGTVLGEPAALCVHILTGERAA